jgi:hypothetical protein
MAVDVIIDPSSGQIYWNDAAGSGTQTIAISGNATNAINIVGYSNFFSPGGGGIGTQVLATFNDSATSTFVPGTSAYDLGSSALRWNFYGTGGNFTGVISTSSATASTSTSTGALTVTGGVGIGGSLWTSTNNFASISGVGHSNSVITSGVWSGTAISAVNGGTGQVSYAIGDLLYASSTSALSKLAAGTAGSILTSGGAGAAPYWSAVSSSGGTVSAGTQYQIAGYYSSVGSSITGSATLTNNTATGIVTISHTTASTAHTNGALVIHGGLGVTGNINSNGIIKSTYTSGNALNIADRVTVSTTGGFENLNVNSNYSFAFNVQDTSNNNRFTVDVQNNRTNFSGSSAAHEIRFYHSNQTSYTGFKANSSGTVTYTWPAGDGSAGQVLYTNGSAGLAWTTPGAAGGGTSGVQAGAQYEIAYYTATGSSVSGSSTLKNDTAAAKVSITHTTASTSTTTGALVISGGVGIAGSIWSGQHIITDTTASTTTATGALLVFGGLGVSGQINSASLVTSGNAVISGNLQFNGVGTFGNATSDTITYNARANSDFLPSTDNSYDLGNNSLGWRNFRVSGVGTVATLQVTSITSGLWAGSAITLAYGGTNNNISGVGHSYRVAIYDAAGTAITNISSAGTANSVLFQSSQSASPNWAGQSQLVVGGASTAANIQGGALGNIHYQTGANTTGFVTNAAGSGASVLTQTGNAAPLFLGQSQLVVGGATTAAQWQTARTVTFATGDVTGSFSISGSADVSNVALTIAANSVALGTDTTGNYAQSVAVAGSGLTLGGTVGEGTDFTVYSNGTSANTVSTLVFRDGSGNFSAGTITASLTGTASIATSSVSSATTTDTSNTLYLLGSRSSTGFAGTSVFVDSNISIKGFEILTGVWSGTAISAIEGGTGQISYTVGDILYASSTTALSKLAAGTAGSVLASGGPGVAPYWKVDATGGGGGTPAGSTSWLQYNNGGSFGATSYLAYDGNLNDDFIISTPLGGATQGQVNVGLGITGFDGVTLGKFAGSASGTVYAANQSSGFSGNFADFQLAGSSKFTIGFDGKVTVVGAFSLPITAGTAGSILTSNGTGNQLYWSAPAAGGGSGTVSSGTAGSIAYYTTTGTTVGGAPGFTYTTSGTASTVNVFGGSAIGTTIFTVQAYSATSVRVGIGTNLPQYELEIVGEISATNKSFVIDHPTKPGKKLRYGSLEGPENGVYVRGELKGSNVIETPDHWEGLVYPDSFTVTLTPIGRFSHLYVEKIEDYKVFIADAYMNPIHCYYTVWAERKDIPKLITEY